MGDFELIEKKIIYKIAQYCTCCKQGMAIHQFTNFYIEPWAKAAVGKSATFGDWSRNQQCHATLIKVTICLRNKCANKFLDCKNFWPEYNIMPKKKPKTNKNKTKQNLLNTTTKKPLPIQIYHISNTLLQSVAVFINQPIKIKTDR